MPMFKVRMLRDAYVELETLVEADTGKQAELIASRSDYDGELVETGNVFEYDDIIVDNGSAEQVPDDHKLIDADEIDNEEDVK